MPYHVSTDEFELIARRALDVIPEEFRTRMEADNLLITIRDGSEKDGTGEDADERVLGYYQGDTESFFSPFDYPKRIVLLQRHIERWCRSYDELVVQVTDTLLHEVAHYFGMNHDDIRQTRLRH